MAQFVHPCLRKQAPAATKTRHGEVERSRCQGGLFRTQDGADRLAEYSGRIVVKCDRCGAQFSLSMTER